MLSLTRKSDYALVAMVSLAQNAPEAASARELADRLGLPLAALRNILKDLTRSGLLESTQGTSGGYRLAYPPEKITLSGVIRAIEGPVRLTSCCETESPPGSDACRRADSCRIKATVQELNHKISVFLGAVTLSQLAGEAALAFAEEQGMPMVTIAMEPHAVGVRP